MAEQLTTQQAQATNAALPAKEQAAAAAAQTLDQAIQSLAIYGGFDLLESSIDGVKSMNPARKALRNVFMTEDTKKSERDNLKSKLKLWISVLSEGRDAASISDKCTENASIAGATLNDNLKTALQATHQLETAYRSLDLFYKNAETDKLKNLTVINAPFEEVTDMDGELFKEISAEIKQNYDRLDMRENYGMLVLPGYLGGNAVVEKWAKMAHENKVMLITDYEDLGGVDEVIEEFNKANLTGGDVYRANVMMVCNWLVARAKNQEVGETDDVVVPPSAALAGKVYSTLMSQPAAGKKYGGVNEVDAVKFPLKKGEIGMLDKIGLIPMVNEYGKVMAFSAKTLFNGDNLGLQTYSVVRVFDYINKTLIDFLNRRAFENWTTKTDADLRSQIVGFLDSIKGPDKLIERFRITKFERDDNQKDRIFLDINITPYFPAKSFMLKLDGMNGKDGPEWDTKTEQQ